MPEYTHESLRRILGLAATASAEERPAILDRECTGNASLRRQIEAMLAARDEVFRSSPTGDNAGPARGRLGESPTIAVPSHEHPGQIIGRYKLLELLGEGGFGSVWAAEQREPVKRRVALKIIKLGMDTRQVIARFEAERQTLAMMDHPNIAKIYDAGATEAGRPYFVMELIRGVPVLEYCDTEKIDTRARLELFVAICHAIQHAHQKGIIHRDIKPSNVLITMHDGVPIPKVIDFGIAKATTVPLTDKTVYTEFRQFIGTPEYTSPEQAEMSGLDIDTRSDIYSLGVLLYELLTGTTPLDRSMLRTAALGEIFRIIRDVEPPTPSTRLHTRKDTLADIAARRRTEPAKLRRIIRGDLDWIVMKCLEKDRARRYETANGLAADIGRHLVHEPVTAGPPSSLYRIRKLVRRHRSAFSIIAGGVLLLLATTLGTSWQARRATIAEAEQRRLFNVAETARKGEVEERRRAEERAEAVEQLAYRHAIAAAESAIYDGQGYAAWPILNSVPETRRGWEWRHLSYASANGTTGFSIASTDGTVPEFQMCNDGRIAAADVGANLVRFFAPAQGTLMGNVALPAGAQHCIMNADAIHAWIAMPDGWELYDVVVGRRLWSGSTVEGRPCFSPDGRTAYAVCSAPARLVRIDLVHQGAVHTNEIPRSEALVYKPHADHAISLADHGAVLILPHWYIIAVDARTGEFLWQGPGAAAGLTPDERQILVRGESELSLRDARTGRTISEYRSSKLIERCSGVSPDGQLVYVGDRDGGIVALEVPSLKMAFRLPSLASARRMSLTPDGEMLVAESADGIIRTASAFIAPRPLHAPDASGGGHTNVVSPDGSLLALGDWGVLRVLDANTGRLLWTCYPQTWFVFAVAFSPDSRLIVCASKDTAQDTNPILLFDARTGSTVRKLATAWDTTLFINALAFSPDAKRIAVGLSDGTLRLISSETGELLETIDAPQPGASAGGSVRWVEFASDGQRLVTATTDVVSDDTTSRMNTLAAIRLWQLGAPSSKLWEFEAPFRSIAMHGNHMAIASDADVRLFDLETGKPSVTLTTAPPVCSLTAFSPDGKRLAVGCDDGAVRLWPIDDPAAQLADANGVAQPIAVLHCGRGDRLSSVGFTWDGTSIVGTCRASMVFRLETVPPSALIARERELMRRCYQTIIANAEDPTLVVPRIQAVVNVPADVRRVAAELAPLVLFKPRHYINEATVNLRRHYDRSRPPIRSPAEDLRRVEISLSCYPPSPSFLELKGHLLCMLERWKDADAAFQESLKSGPPILGSISYAAFAGVLANLNRLTQAEALLHKAREVAEPDCPPSDRGAIEWAEAALRSAQIRNER